MAYPKVTVAQVETYALGGGFEIALMADLAVVARDAKLGMPGARLLGPALGNLHLFFHRLGPVLTRRLLLTGDTVTGAEVEHLGVFTEVCDADDVAARAERWAAKAARMPADGIAIAKTSFALVEQSTAFVGEEASGFLVHAFATNLRFEEDEFNFVKTRAKVGHERGVQGRATSTSGSTTCREPDRRGGAGGCAARGQPRGARRRGRAPHRRPLDGRRPRRTAHVRPRARARAR